MVLSDHVKENTRQIESLWKKYDSLQKKRTDEKLVTALYRQALKNRVWALWALTLFFIITIIGLAIWIWKLIIQIGAGG